MTKTTRMIEQECYKADDGRVFDTIEQCWLYEKQKQTDETLFVCRPCRYDQPCDMFYRTSEHDSTSTEEVLRHEDYYINEFLFSLGSSSREVSMKSDWLIRTLARLDYASDLLGWTVDEYGHRMHRSIGSILKQANLCQARWAYNTESWVCTGIEWNNKQKHNWRFLLEQWGKPSIFEKHKVLKMALNLLTGEHWQTTTIKGCSQADWRVIVYDADKLDRRSIDWFEAEFFNLGRYYEVMTVDEYLAEENGYSAYIHDTDKLAEELGINEANIIVTDEAENISIEG